MKTLLTLFVLLFAAGLTLPIDSMAQSQIFDEVAHHYADNGGVRIHYVSADEGPLVVFIHGFPDFWYTWRHQMAGLMGDHRVFHGLADTALNSDGLNNTWDWIDADLTLVTAPGAGHFVQQDAAELVTNTMRWWLGDRAVTR